MGRTVHRHTTSRGRGMTRLRALAAFLYDFVVGEDPVIAVVVIIGLGITAAIAKAGIAAWWVLPAAVLFVLTISLHRASR